VGRKEIAMTFRALAAEGSFVREVRKTGKDSLGNDAELWRAGERYPCRHCLNEVPKDKGVLLVSYQPLERRTPFAGRGPIFLCADECEAFTRHDEVPEIVASRRINLRAYDKSGKMLYRHSRLAEGAEAGMHLEEMLADAEVSEVHVHTALHGCYLCKFVRA
jgi:hypothetical protein